MSRRGCLAAGAVVLLGSAGASWAGALDGISAQQAAQALRQALEQGARAAVSQLGRADGFWGNPAVRIPLPPALEQASSLLRTLGQGAQVDALRLAANRAAEAAVPKAQAVLLAAVKSLTVEDAKTILTGGDTSVTDFFSGRTRQPLSAQFLPLVQQATQEVGLAAQYDRLAAQASKLGLLRGDDGNLARFVTGKTLDGLYRVVGEQERRLRQDPMAAGTDLLKKVFGALR